MTFCSSPDSRSLFFPVISFTLLPTNHTWYSQQQVPLGSHFIDLSTYFSASITNMTASLPRTVGAGVRKDPITFSLVMAPHSPSPSADLQSTPQQLALSYCPSDLCLEWSELGSIDSCCVTQGMALNHSKPICQTQMSLFLAPYRDTEMLQGFL